MTVAEAVLKVLIAHYPSVKNHIIQAAHPMHQMSGLHRLRELSRMGVVSYAFDNVTNEYYIHTPLVELKTALVNFKDVKRRTARGTAAGLQGRVGPHKPDMAGSSPAPATTPEIAGQQAPLTRWEPIPDDVRKFINSL